MILYLTNNFCSENTPFGGSVFFLFFCCFFCFVVFFFFLLLLLFVCLFFCFFVVVFCCCFFVCLFVCFCFFFFVFFFCFLFFFCFFFLHRVCYPSYVTLPLRLIYRERGNLSAFRTFVRFVLVWICRFPLPLGVWEGLRFLIVALLGLFSYLFFFHI